MLTALRFSVLRNLAAAAVMAASLPGGLLMAQTGPDNPEEQESGEEILAREQFYYMRRAGGPDKVIPDDAYARAVEQYLRMPSDRTLLNSPTADLTWESVNPTGMFYARTNANYISGRTNDMAFHPTDPNTMLIGAAGGGVWKTTDAGVTWAPLTDNLTSLTVGAVAFDPNNSNKVYFGTGELNFSLDSYYGDGLYKSVNGGGTWTKIATTSIGKYYTQIVVDPTNSSVIYVATSNGVYKSINAGGSFATTGAGSTVTSLIIDPTNTQVLYCSRGGTGVNQVRKTTNAGGSWTTLAGGLPANGGRTQLAMCGSNSNVLYASIAKTSGGSYQLLGLYLTTDAGATWTLQNSTTNYMGSQGWYDNAVTVDPSDPTRVIVGGLDIYASTNSGSTLSQKSVWFTTNPSQMSHADIHYLGYRSGVLYCGSDGGVYKSTNNGTSWSDLNATLSTLQYQSADYDPTDVQKMYGGCQDNNLETTTNGGADWIQRTTGDGGYSVVDPVDPNYVYGQYVQGSIKRSGDYGVNFTEIAPSGAAAGGLFYNPYEMAPGDHNTVVYGKADLWKTTDVQNATSGSGWVQIATSGTIGGNISSIGISTTTTNKIYVGTSGGLIEVTTDNGGSWTVRSGFPYVSDFAVDPANDNVAYAGCGGFSSGTASGIYKTTNAGSSWTAISTGMPFIPVNSLILRSASPRTLFAGTDLGVYKTTDEGATWVSFNNGLPPATVYDMKYKEGNGLLMAATHGRGVWTMDLATPVFSVSPSSLDFDSVATGSNKVDSVNVSNPGFTTLSVTSDTADNPEFTVTPPSDTVPAGSNRWFYVTFTPASLGPKTGNVIFTHDASGSPDSVALSGLGYSTPPSGGTFTVVPDSGIALQTLFTLTAAGWTDPDPPLQYRFAYKNGSGSEVSLSSYSPSNSLPTVLPAGAAPSYDLTLYAYIADTYGSATKESTVANVRPTHVVDPLVLPYGGVEFGQSKSDSFKVKTLGNSSIIVLSAQSSDTQFTVSPQSGAVPVGDSLTFTVVYQPAAPGPGSAEIVLSNDDGSFDTLDASGTGTVAVTLRKFQDADGDVGSDSDRTTKKWSLALYRDSVSGGTLVAQGDSSVLAAFAPASGTYIAAEADSGPAWQRIGGNGTRYDTLAVGLTALEDTFVNFKSNAVTIRKFADQDDDFSTVDDRAAAAWHLELRKDSLNGTVVGSGDNPTLVVPNLGDGEYYAVEADSAGWIHLGTIVDLLPDEDSSAVVHLSLSNGEAATVDFINGVPGGSKAYHTAKYEHWATAIDHKGKLKAVKKKADKVEFKFNLVAPKTASLKVTFNMLATGAVTRGKAKLDTMQTFTLLKVVNTAVIDSGDTVQFDGFGVKGNLLKTKYEWATAPKVTKGKVASYKMNQPRLPSPNLHNIGEELFLQNAFPGGLLVGVPQGLKGANSVLMAKYQRVLASMNKKGTLHDDTPLCLDVFTSNDKPINKQQKSLPPDKQNNPLFAEVMTLKLNIAASLFGKFPTGLGQLTYNDPDFPGDLLNGQTVDSIVIKADRVLSCLVDTSKGNELTPDDVYEVVRKINVAFADSLADTVSFSGKTVLKGTVRLLDAPYLHLTPGLEPRSIFSSAPIPVQLPAEYRLNQNYPNPFNPTTTISFDLATAAFVTLKVYNVLGEEVAVLADREIMDEGEQEVVFNAAELASGVYFCRLLTEPAPDDDGEIDGRPFVSVRKMLLLR